MPVETRPVVVNADRLSVRYGTQVVLDQTSFTIHAGDRIALVGRNGAGKSTVLKLLGGVEEPDEGAIQWQRGLTTGYLPQDVTLDGSRTVEANILHGARHILAWRQRYETMPHDTAAALELEARINAHRGWDLERQCEELVSRLEAPDPARIVATLSGGEQRRVGLCQALLGQPDLLMLDEPTNHLDTESIAWLEGWLASYGGTCIMVTHDRLFLDRVATRILEVAAGQMHCHAGDYAAFLEARLEREQGASRREASRQHFLRRELDWIRRGPKARTTKSRSRVQRFEDAADEAAPELVGNVEMAIPAPPKLGNRVVELCDVGMTLGDRCLFSGVNLRLEPGERMGMLGRNGAGKTTLLKIMLGLFEPSQGTVEHGDLTQFNYVDQHRLQLNESQTVLDEVADGNEFVQLGESRITVWAYLKRFLFTDERIMTPVHALSGGERSRLLLAKILKKGGNVLVLDEPTNDLDLATLCMLEEALSEFAGCVVVVSHDRTFLNRICTSILAIEPDGQVVYQPGDYDYYQQKLRDRLQLATTPAPKPRQAAPPAAPGTPGARRLKWREKRELEGMETAILEAEAAVEELESVFSSPDFYAAHGDRAQALTQELAEGRARVTALYARWEELETAREAELA